MIVETELVQPELQAMLSSCRAAGMPDDQIDRFVQAGYIVLPQNMPFHVAARAADDPSQPDEIALGGTRGSAKSHTIMAQVGLDDCLRYPGLKVLFLRKVMKSAAESLDDLVRKVFQFVRYSANGDGVKFPNGSRILIGGYKDPRDIDKYLGLEYDIIVIEEATQLTEEKKEKIGGSLRSSKPGWRPRMYLSTNPDGIGLAWFKRLYVLPWRAHREITGRFIQTSYRGNPFIDQGYKTWLQGLTGPLAKAWEACDWDAFSGMAFPNWDYVRHVIEPADTFDIPTHWPIWRCIDWGLAAPFCCLWLAKNPDTKRLYAYREAYQAGLTVPQQIELILTMTPATEAKRLQLTYADPALWQRSTYKNITYSTADEYRTGGLPLTRADNDRLQGIRKVHTALGDIADGRPGLQVFYTCEHLIEQLGNLARDELRPEDVDTAQEDHAYDTLRYGLTNEKRLQPGDPNDKKREQNPMNRYARTT